MSSSSPLACVSSDCVTVIMIVISVTSDDNVTLCLTLDVTDHSGSHSHHGELAGTGQGWSDPTHSGSSQWPLWAPSSSSSQFSVLCWLRRQSPGPQCWPGSLATAPLPATSHGLPCTPCTEHLQLSEKD